MIKEAALLWLMYDRRAKHLAIVSLAKLYRNVACERATVSSETFLGLRTTNHMSWKNMLITYQFGMVRFWCPSKF